MFSSPPPPAYDYRPLPIICENIQRTGIRTKREFNQYLKDYSAAQARNRGLYAVQGERERKTWGAEVPRTYQRGEGVEYCRVAGTGSPLLEARLHLREKVQEQETSWVDIGNRAPIQIKKEMVGPDEDTVEGHKRIGVVTGQENGSRRKQDESNRDKVREENEQSNSKCSILNDVHSFLSVVTQLLPAGLAQRRARRRAKKEIINPSTPMKVLASKYQKPSRKRKQDEENDSDNNGDQSTRKKKQRKSKVALGISLMENFTAKNVGHGRLTVRGQFSERVLSMN
jgi:hypothetical protein